MSWHGSRISWGGHRPEGTRPPRQPVSQRAFLTLIAIALVVLTSLVPAAAQRPNGVGLVVRHGDGTVLYFYIQFEGDSINAEEALYRTELPMEVAPYGGLGTGVCRLDGEGCSSDNCYCESYGTPAYYWHYYALENGGWVEQIRGPSSRELHDGDVDGWSWTAGDSGLPATNIDAIAELNGVDRSEPEPTATATATTPPPTPTPEPTATEPPPPPPATATATQPQVEPTATTAQTNATATVANSPTATAGQSAQLMTPSASPTQPVATRAARNPTVTTAPQESTETPTAVATTLGVVVPPNGTPVAVVPAAPEGDSNGMGDYLAFGAIAAVVVAGGGVVVWRRRAG